MQNVENMELSSMYQHLSKVKLFLNGSKLGQFSRDWMNLNSSMAVPV